MISPQLTAKEVSANSTRGPEGPFYCWHTIIYRNTTRTFHERETDRPNIWDQRGLCRIKIDAGKFVVLFPDLTETDGDSQK